MRGQMRLAAVLSALAAGALTSAFTQRSSFLPKTRTEQERQFGPLASSTTRDTPTDGVAGGTTKKTLAGVSVLDVQSGLDVLYPPTELAQRNALSRTDGYWPYIKDGVEPPLEYTYGEYDIDFFGTILDKAIDFVEDVESWDDRTFCDVGSGTGRLVLGAAALYPHFRLCRGVEYLEGCHKMAMEIVEKCQQADDGRALLQVGENGQLLPTAPIELTLGSIGAPETFVGDVDVFFVSSSAMPPEVLTMVSEKVASQCKSGTLVVTMDYEIPTQGQTEDGSSFEFEKLHEMDGYCWVVGGTSTAHFFRLK